MTAPEAQPATSARTPTSAQTPTMHIGALAERTGMSLRTLRHYDETGLLEPSGRSEGGFRLYTEDDLARLLVIRRMKPLGFSLDEMADLLDVVDQLRASPGGAGATEGSAAEGDATEAIEADGIATDGIAADGIATDGIAADGIAADGAALRRGGPGSDPSESNPSDGDRSGDPRSALRARLDAYVESAETRRAELARKLDMADEFIGLLRST